MSIGDLWAGGGGTVYIQEHPVIPNPWGDAVTNGTTTTTTDDTTAKSGGDDAEPCGKECDQYKRCMWRCFSKCEGKGSSKELGDCIGDVSKKDPKDDDYAQKWSHWGEVKDQAENFWSSIPGIIFGDNPIKQYFNLVHLMQDYGFLGETSNPSDVLDAYNKWKKIENKCRDYCAKYWPAEIKPAN